MKASLIGSFILILLSLSLSVGYSAKYTDQQNGFSIKIPKDYQKVDNPRYHAYFVQTNGGYRIGISVLIETNEVELLRYVVLYREAYRLPQTDLNKEASSSKLRLTKTDKGWAALFYLDEQNQKMLYALVVLAKGRRVYLIDIQSTADYFEENGASLNKILDSFRALKVK